MTSARYVLGVDAAWTEGTPSGTALVDASADPPRLLTVARSFSEFCALASKGSNSPDDWATAPVSDEGSLADTLAAATQLTGSSPDLVSLDIPLSPCPITGSRSADQAVARGYGSKKASPYTPTEDLPGVISVRLFVQLEEAGYTWLPAVGQAAASRVGFCFLETYPHPAIIELLDLQERLPYKVGKRSKYWNWLRADERWARAAKSLDTLRAGLNRALGGVADLLPSAQQLLAHRPELPHERPLKGIEDALDAVVCAWVGCEHLAGRTAAYGDDTSAIWLPAARR